MKELGSDFEHVKVLFSFRVLYEIHYISIIIKTIKMNKKKIEKSEPFKIQEINAIF